MKESLFGLLKKEYLSEVSVTMKNKDTCALTIQKARIIKRNAIEHEIQFINLGQLYIFTFKASRKHFSLTSTYPLKGIISCINHDGSMVKKIRMGYFKKQEILLTDLGNMNLSFLLNDLINTTQLAKKNPGIIAEYYRYIREKLILTIPPLASKEINYQIIAKSPYAAWLSDTIRKKHFFSYNGVNMLLSFQAIIENHPELFTSFMN